MELFWYETQESNCVEIVNGRANWWHIGRDGNAHKTGQNVDGKVLSALYDQNLLSFLRLTDNGKLYRIEQQRP